MHYAPYGHTNQESNPGSHQLPAKALLALDILQSEPRGLYGLDVVARSHGRLSRASIYIVLGDLEARGLVNGKRVIEPGWIPRPLYTISARGLHALADCELRGTLRPRLANVAR